MAKVWERPDKDITEKAAEVKHEVKSEQPQLQKDNLKTIVAQAEQSTPVYLGSEIDAYVHERVKGQPKTLTLLSVMLFGFTLLEDTVNGIFGNTANRSTPVALFY